ncbi:uncharacterized protein A4U43_C04F22270 [Asparagus officinalis]|uniref:Uncharacterized protein n=1 Tax=Asparagus officinalis TaxID=4686 RepID=A0A5P1F2X1_ASPOF|nr:uncharacterized protein A4U43_C04F22270 [Asparagus officinalis]
MEGAAITPLPRSSDLSTALRCFLSSSFETNHDMLRSVHLESDLRSSFTNLEASLSDLGRRLSDSVALLRPLGSDGFERSEQILGEELPALAKEVARVDTVRAYAGE